MAKKLKTSLAPAQETVETRIITNGSKWAGQQPDSIEKLIEALNEHDLDLERYAAFGFIDFVDSNGYGDKDYDEHTVKIHGNFINLSRAFEIEGIYSNLESLIWAIERNIKSQCGRVAPRKISTVSAL